MPTFVKDLIERAVKTAAQTAIALIGTTALVTDLNWEVVGSGVAMATVLSVLTSVASYGAGDTGTASLVKTEPATINYRPGEVHENSVS